MKNRIQQLIDDFHERRLPQPIARDIRMHSLRGKADVVIGMRRCGKTWFCYQNMAELLAAGVERERILYLNFEDERLPDFSVADFQAILDVYYGKYPSLRDGRCYFFFDEIQRIDNWEMFVRRLLDTENVQVVLTGSSSKLLSTEIATALRGRSLPIEIFPFSFKEFLRCRGIFGEVPHTFGADTASHLRKAIGDYFNVGGFPEVQTVDGNLRIEILQGYIDSVILKDVIERHAVSNIVVLKHLVRHMMNAAGAKFSINKFYNTMRSLSIKCTKNSLYAYLDHLTDAFVFFTVPVHSRSEKARLVNPSKVYAIDTGLLKAMTFRHSADNGRLLENMVFIHLRREGWQAEYYTSKDGHETDFRARHRVSGDVQLIQVCWSVADEHTFQRELRGLKSAMAELSIPSGTIVTWDDEASPAPGIRLVPVWKWLLEARPPV